MVVRVDTMDKEQVTNVSWPQGAHSSWPGEPIHSQKFPANVEFINNLKLDQKLQPKEYHVEGTHQRSRILFTDVKILDSTGREPYIGDVLIEGELPY
jgi:hypothetical protein